MFTSLIIAKAAAYTQGGPDKNGKNPIILVVIAGKCPNRNVISGTVAESAGIEAGKTYLFQVREGNPDPQYGRRFVFTSLGEAGMKDIIDAQTSLGAAEVFTVEAPAAPGNTETVFSEAVGSRRAAAKQN